MTGPDRAPRDRVIPAEGKNPDESLRLSVREEQILLLLSQGYFEQVDRGQT